MPAALAGAGDIDIAPAEVRRQADHAAVGDEAGHREGRAHHAKPLPFRRADDLSGEPAEVPQYPVRRATTLVATADLQAALASGEVEHAGGEIVHIDLETEPSRTLGRNRQADRRATGSGARRRADLGQQSAAEQFLDEGGDSCLGQSGDVREISTRDRAGARGHVAQDESEVVLAQAPLPHGLVALRGGGGHALTMPHGHE